MRSFVGFVCLCLFFSNHFSLSFLVVLFSWRLNCFWYFQNWNVFGFVESGISNSCVASKWLTNTSHTSLRPSDRFTSFNSPSNISKGTFRQANRRELIYYLINFRDNHRKPKMKQYFRCSYFLFNIVSISICAEKKKQTNEPETKNRKLFRSKDKQKFHMSKNYDRREINRTNVKMVFVVCCSCFVWLFRMRSSSTEVTK